MRARAFFCAALLVLTGAAAGCTAKAPQIPVPVFLACNEVQEILKDMPFDHVGRTHGTVAQPLTTKESPGCHIVAKGAHSRVSVLERTSKHSPGGRLKELLPARGWREDTRFADEHPGGETFAFERGGVLCDFAARWNIDGESPDPEAPGPDRYEISVGCALAGT